MKIDKENSTLRYFRWRSLEIGLGVNSFFESQGVSFYLIDLFQFVIKVQN